MYLGLDIGTSIIKAALFDQGGRERTSVVRKMQLLDAPQGWSELDGESVWQAVVAVIAQLFASTSSSPSEVRAVGVTGVMVGTWLIDDSGFLVRPPILWNDARAQNWVDKRSQDEPDLLSKVFALSGSVMQFGCTLPVLAWLKENEPKTLDRARHVLCAKDFIRYRLTGELLTDESEAAMAPGSADSRDFHPGQAKLLDVEDLGHLLVPVRRAETNGGRITATAAALTGLRIGTPVAVGTGDTGSSVIGAGCHQVGQAASILGTTCLNGVLSDHPVFEPKDLGLLFILPGQRWMKTMANVAGTTVLDWCLAVICPDIAKGKSPYEALERLAKTSPPGANGLVFVPYLSASGVIAPKIEPRARAGFFGLAPHHDHADLVRAVYESMAYAIRDSFAAIGGSMTSIRLGGGGARSRFWGQIIADVGGIRVEVPHGTQFGAKGAILCAATSIGAFSSIGEACAATYCEQVGYQPNDTLSETYENAFRRFKVASAAALGPLTELAI